MPLDPVPLTEEPGPARFGIIRYNPRPTILRGFFRKLLDPEGREVSVRMQTRDGPVTIPISSCIIEEKPVDRSSTDGAEGDGV